MARLKRRLPRRFGFVPNHRLTDRIRDGAIETHCIDLLLKNMGTSGLPIGFAMARLKRSYKLTKRRFPWLTDRIRDGAIETKLLHCHQRQNTYRGLPIGFAMARLKQYLLVEEARLGRRGLPIGFAMARLKRFVLELTNDDFPPMAYRSDSRWRD